MHCVDCHAVAAAASTAKFKTLVADDSPLKPRRAPDKPNQLPVTDASGPVRQQTHPILWDWTMLALGLFIVFCFVACAVSLYVIWAKGRGT